MKLFRLGLSVLALVLAGASWGATLGNNTFGASTRTINNNVKGYDVTMPEDAQTGFSIWAYLNDSATGDEFQAALVDPADGVTVLAESAVRTDISTAGWYEFSGGDFDTYEPANAEQLYLAVGSNSAASAVIFYEGVSTAGLQALAAGSVDPFVINTGGGGQLAADTTRPYSIYMEYTAAGGGDVTAPTCSVAPVEDSDTDTTVTADATCSDETDSTVDHYWGVTANDATDPTPAELRTNTYGGTFIDYDASDAAVTNGVESQVVLTGLSANTAYDVFHTVCDSSDNCKTVVQVDITTDAATFACSLTDASPVPGATTHIDCTGGTGGTIVSLTSPEGVAKNVQGGADAIDADWVNWAQSDFVASGAAQNVEWNLSGTWVVSNGTETANVTMQIDPVDTNGPDEWFGTVTTPAGDSVFPSAAAANDEYYVERVSGTNVDVLTNGSTSADTDYEVDAWIWDESANSGNGQWSAVENTVFDATAPEIDSVTIASNGTTVTIVYDQAVSVGAGGSTGNTLLMSGGNVVLTYASGADTDTLVWTAARTIEAGETGTLTYSQPANGLEDAVGNDVVSTFGVSVTNNSTADVDAPIFSSASIPSAGTTLIVVFDENVTQGAGYDDGDWAAAATNGALTFVYASGDGTNSHTLTASRTIGIGETVTLDWAGTANGLEDGGGNDVAAFSDESVTNSSTADITAPTITGIATNSAGTTVSFTSAENLNVGSGGNGGFAATMSGGATTLTYSSGDGTTTLVYSSSRAILSGETGTAAYTQPGDGIEDDGGNDLATFSGTAVSNNSTNVAPAFSSASIPSAGTSISIVLSESVDIGAGGNGGFAIASCSGGAVTPTYSSGSGSTTLVYTLSRTIGSTETGCTVAYTQPGNGVEDATDVDLASFTAQAVTNGSTQDLVAPTVTSASINAAAMSVFFSEEPFQGAGYNNSHWTVTCSGGAVTPTLLAIGSISILFELSREVTADETCTLAHDGSANGVEDAAGNDLAAFSGQAITISSGNNCSMIRPTIQPTVSETLCAY